MFEYRKSKRKRKKYNYQNPPTSRGGAMDELGMASAVSSSRVGPEVMAGGLTFGRSAPTMEGPVLSSKDSPTKKLRSSSENFLAMFLWQSSSQLMKATLAKSILISSNSLEALKSKMACSLASLIYLSFSATLASTSFL